MARRKNDCSAITKQKVTKSLTHYLDKMFNDKKVNVQVTIAKSMAYFTSDSEFAGKIDRGYKVSSLILYEHIVLSYNQKLFDLNQKKFYGFQQN